MTVFYKRLPGYEDRVRVLRCDEPDCGSELRDTDAAYEGWTECRRLNKKDAARHICPAHDAEPVAETEADEPAEVLPGIYAGDGSITAPNIKVIVGDPGAAERVYTSIIDGRVWPRE